LDADLLKRQRQPLLIVLSGPSGAGKDAVLRRMKERGLPFHFVVTATTRPQRAGEVDGQDYVFVRQGEFAEMIERDELLEYAIVYSDYKGIPKKQVRDALATGLDVVLRIDVQGAETVRALSPEALLIFLCTSTEADLVTRLQARHTETPESLKLRIATAVQEMNRVDVFDYFVINPNLRLDDTVDTVLAIIHAEHHRTHPRRVTL